MAPPPPHHLMAPSPPHHLNPPFPHPSLGHGHGVGGGVVTPGCSDYKDETNAVGPSPGTLADLETRREAALGAQRQTDAAGNTVGFIGNLTYLTASRRVISLLTSPRASHVLLRLLRLRLLSSDRRSRSFTGGADL